MSRRIVLFTGKGGVGKTTVAAATALRLASQGCKTLIMSVDPAHSLSDALGRPLGPEPGEVTTNLYAMELDVYYSMKKHWGNIRSLMLTAFKWQGVSSIQAEELAALPGMEEASAFLWLEQFYQAGDFEVIVVDSAPTGETLAFLTLPQVTNWWMQKAFPGQRYAMQGFGMMTRMTTGIPLDKGLREMEGLFEKLEFARTVLSDPQVTSMRVVLNPERMVISEAQRAYAYLQLYGYPVDSVIVNRILPELQDPVFAPYIAAQRAYLPEIDELFAPLPVLRVPHLGREVFGLELLAEIGERLWCERNPRDSFCDERPYLIEEVPGGYALRIKAPSLAGLRLSAEQFGDTLVIQAGNRRRNIVLPRFLGYYRLKDSTLDNDWLTVTFAPPA
jgi:arsenite-transporting ATPase